MGLIFFGAFPMLSKSSMPEVELQGSRDAGDPRQVPRGNVLWVPSEAYWKRFQEDVQ